MNLYWITTPDGNENWFVVAETKSLAQEFHEYAEGYGGNYAVAKLVCPISNELTKKHVKDEEADWPTHELLKDLGAKILTESNPRIVNINGLVYREGNFTENIFHYEHNKEAGVYVIKVQDTNQYKIGMTTNLARRIKQIRASNPFNVKLVYFVATEHYRSLEVHLHKLFKGYRGIGEWFYFQEDDLYELELNLLLLDQEGKGMFKFYNIKRLSMHGRQY